MAFLDLLKKLFKPANQGNIIKIYLKDNKCGQKIKVLLRKSYDLQRVYSDDQTAAFALNKVVICDKCFNQIKVKLHYDQKYNNISQEINGGELISEEEFNEDIPARS